MQVLNPEETPYAILSHTWGTGEVTFDDIQDVDIARTRPAWDKVQQTCRIARERDLSFVWIDRRALLDPECLSTMAVARRMSWAAKRQTTRPEDLAYCLLGIFDVNMPLIYGEGANAFVRLQEAIALATEDLSLFAWTWPETPEAPRYSGLLARSPSHFERCGLLRNNENPLEYDSKSFTMVNHGLRFQTYLLTDDEKGKYLIPPHCHMHPVSRTRTVLLPLIKTGTGFVRHDTDQVLELFSTMHSASWDPLPRTLTIPKVLRHADRLRVRRRFHDAFHFSVSIIGNWEIKLSATVPDRWDEAPSGTPWDASTGRYITNSYSSFAGMLTGTIHDKEKASLDKAAQFLIFFGFDGEYMFGDHFKRETWIALSRSDANSPIKRSSPKRSTSLTFPSMFWRSSTVCTIFDSQHTLDVSIPKDSGLQVKNCAKAF